MQKLFLDVFAGQMTAEEFAKWLGGEASPDYTIKYGAGTAYYVSDCYVELSVDGNGDGFGEMTLQIALDEAQMLSKDAKAWLCYAAW